MSDGCRESGAVMGGTSRGLAHMPEGLVEFEHFGGCPPKTQFGKERRVEQPQILTFLSNPRIKTGNIFRLSEMDNCALAPAPAAVMLDLYVCRMSTNFWKTASLASSSLCVSERSTALFAKSVAIAT
jgi:hypothetical protein